MADRVIFRVKLIQQGILLYLHLITLMDLAVILSLTNLASVMMDKVKISSGFLAATTLNVDMIGLHIEYWKKDKRWVADLGGNNLRLIAFIEFRHQGVDVKYIVDHTEYDRLTDRCRRKELT